MHRFRLASRELRVPMPDRGRDVFFTTDDTGEVIDPVNPYYARMIADGDLVPTDGAPAKPKTRNGG